MDKKFYGEWFRGFSDGIERLEEDARSCLLRCCAERCADTGVLTAYRQLYAQVGGNRDGLFRQIEKLGGVRGEVTVPGRRYAVIFPECVCDLHRTGGVETPALCECSRQSILYVCEQIWGPGEKCTVRNRGTVLSGERECRFDITFEQRNRR